MRPARDAIEGLVEGLVASGMVSAVVALVGGADEIEWSRVAGWARGGPEAAGWGKGRRAEISAWFDFGSLTKPFVATLALVLDRTRELPLAARIGEVFGGADSRLAALPLSDLLRHRARLQAWTPLYSRCRSLAEVEALLLSGAVQGGRLGTYSDLDYLLWGLAAEKVLGRPLAELVGERVLVPLGLDATVAATPGGQPQVAASRMGSGREVQLAAAQGLDVGLLPPPAPGQPQDGNARFLARLIAGGSGASEVGRGALLGHSGLFGRAAALWRLGAEWLAPRQLLDRKTIEAALAGGGPFALGWWRRRYRGAGGRALSADSFGHTGFAGGSLWIYPERSRVLVLLAHRLEPTVNLNLWRRRFHAAAIRAGGPEI